MKKVLIIWSVWLLGAVLIMIIIWIQAAIRKFDEIDDRLISIENRIEVVEPIH